MSDRTLVYGGYDQEALDRQYSPSSRVPDINVFLRRYAVESARTRSELPVRRDLRYGPAPEETLDMFPARVPDAPLMVFVHGGHWQELSKNEASFPARGMVAAGAAFAALGYGLAPRYGLAEIVDQVRHGLGWLIAHAGELGVDPHRIHLSGSSAGAHLVMMALLDTWRPAGRHPADAFAGAALLSGVYDLMPLRLTYVNEPLGLDSAMAAELSPLRHLPERLPALVIARGRAETEEYARQQAELVRAATPLAAEMRELVAEHRNHFDITFDLDDPATELGAAVFTQMGLDS